MDKLIEAVQNGESERVLHELERFPEKITSRDENGRTLLSWAAQLGHLDVVKILITKGADINTIDNDTSFTETPLHNAVEEIHPDIVEVLIEKGADISVEDCDGRTAIHILANNKAVGIWNEKTEKILKILLRHGAKIDTVPMAAVLGTLQDVKNMVDRGADICERLERSERTALHIAVEENNVELLTYLLEISEDVNDTDFNDLTPVDIAKTEETEVLLRDHGGKSSSEIEDIIYQGFESKDAAMRLLDKIKKT